MNIFVIGGGAREHSIIWSLKKSNNCGDIFCSPGNAGIEKLASCHTLDFNDRNSIIGFCNENNMFRFLILFYIQNIMLIPAYYFYTNILFLY